MKPARYRIAISCIVPMALSCTGISDALKTFTSSSVTIQGVVCDTSRGGVLPLAGAFVAIDGQQKTATTDSGGLFVMHEVKTGPSVVLSVRASGFYPFEKRMDVRVNPVPDTTVLKPLYDPPRITRMSSNSASLFALTDTVKIVCEAADSSGGIARMVFDGGDGRTVEKAVSPVAPSARDSCALVFARPGAFQGRVVVIGARNDSAADTLNIVVPKTRRAAIYLVRPQAEGFISAEYGFLEVFVSDPDGNFSRIKINWGDGSGPDSNFTPVRVGGDSSLSTIMRIVCWHRFVVKADSVMTVRVMVFDTTGFFRESIAGVSVSVASLPLLDGKIFFEPSQYLAPFDDSIVIGVRILEIEGWASEIVWIVNENDPESLLYKRSAYDDLTGAIGPVGNVFAFRFSTEKLKAVNDVHIIVSDRYGNKSDVLGSFYMVGKR
jgi:hypothetical protein